MSHKVNFRTRTTTRNKELHFVMIKELIHKGSITMLNVYAPNNRYSKHTKQKLVLLKVKFAK